MSTQTSPGTRCQGIILVAGHELRARLMRRSTIILTLVLLAATTGGVIGVKLHTSGQDKAYRFGLKDIEASQITRLDKAVAPNGEVTKLVDASNHKAKEVLADDAPEDTPHVDMILDVSGSTPAIIVEEKAGETAVSGATAFLQQPALGQQIASLGDDPTQVAAQLNDAKPGVMVLHVPKCDAVDLRQRYTVLMTIDVLLLLAIMGGGQFIIQGVVEEKPGRVIKVLLTCVRPSLLLAGKILGIGAASMMTTGSIAVIGVITAKAIGATLDISLSLDGALVVMPMWMTVGYAIFAIAYGTAVPLVNHQEDANSVSMPLLLLAMVPYMLSFTVVIGDPNSTILRALSYPPLFIPFMMPTRLVLGVFLRAEQLIVLGVTFVFPPLLTHGAAAIYT